LILVTAPPEVPRHPGARVAVVVPLKDFGRAKERLRSAGELDVPALARRLAEGVLECAAPRDVIVLCESDDVARFAEAHGAEVHRSDARDLNEAVQLAYEDLAERYEQLVVAHGDLLRPEGLGRFEPGSGVTVVTDHHRRGTNVLVVPTRRAFRFSYGPDSSQRHQREALRLGLTCEMITDSPWRYDVDEPEDLDRGPDSS
jgi:2-phospho-L-lactate guanylyltransferase